MLPFSKSWRSARRWKKKKEALTSEDEYYEKEFSNSGLKIPGRQDIIDEMYSRGFILESDRPLHFFAIFRNYNWENASLIPALEEFGSVSHCDWSQFIGRNAGIDKKSKMTINHNIILQFDKLLSTCGVDVVFGYFSGEVILPETLIHFRKSGIPIINLSLNDRELFVGRIMNGQAQGIRDICRYVDISWTSTKSAVKKILVEGGVPVYMPEGANPNLHKPYPLEKKIYPVSFVGACYGERPFYISKLRNSGIDVHTFGEGWESGPVALEEMVKIYSKSWINLGFSGVGELNDTFCLKGRDFEVTMSGGMYLTQHNSELASFFDLGDKEIATWKDLSELLSETQRLLRQPKLCVEIASRGRRKALSTHTWASRIKTLLHFLGCESR